MHWGAHILLDSHQVIDGILEAPGAFDDWWGWGTRTWRWFPDWGWIVLGFPEHHSDLSYLKLQDPWRGAPFHWALAVEAEQGSNSIGTTSLGWDIHRCECWPGWHRTKFMSPKSTCCPWVNKPHSIPLLFFWAVNLRHVKTVVSWLA